MRRIARGLAALGPCLSLALALAACGGSAVSGAGESEGGDPVQVVQDLEAEDVTEQTRGADAQKGSDTQMKTVAIEANGTTWEARLADNSSAEAFAALLAEGPLTLHLHDFGNFEKVGSLGTSLPTNDERITTTPGDLILYQGNEITIYYDQNTWSFTRLGHIDGVTTEGLLSVFGGGDVDVTFSLA